ncbi:unnamed protein product [Caenorhabditis bovis]|uniref:Transmembrane protein INAFM2 n=1 Tax=Caenorhabditis bovis TaxID=2654633 RepID=A0A8S1EDI4_9PELO|nr:unnamed protein product [Caenorhabditis bovis]
MSSGGEWLSIEDLMEKISNKSATQRKMSQANHLSYSARMRGRSKQPVYTSDKRAKFTQRESKKWIRFVTVLGYIFAVSLPAVSLSIYYIYVWDPGYIAKFPPENLNRTPPIQKVPIISKRSDSAETPPPPPIDRHLDLSKILSDGLNSMESKESIPIQS